MIGININCKQHPFVDWIVSGKKTIETRDRPTLDCYVGRRVALIETGRGQATVKGTALIKKRKLYSTEREFKNDYEKHMVDLSSDYYIKDVKYGYVLSDVRKIRPVSVYTKGIISREVFI